MGGNHRSDSTRLPPTPIANNARTVRRMNLTLSQLREYAARGGIDPRTLARFVRGESVKGLAAERCRAALKAAGIDSTAAEAAPSQSAAGGGA